MSKRIYLTDIVKTKRTRLEEKKLDKSDLVNRITQIKRPSFYNAMIKNGLSIIGEVKKASPSKGLIKEDFSPLNIAQDYEKSVDAISVLTEEDYFLGRDEYLQEVSNSVTLPTLCKDFIIDANQIYNAKVLGASCILLIVAILTDCELKEYIELAHDLELDALVEVHSKDEIDRALKAGAKIVGINNRDLKTFETDIANTLELRKYIPNDLVVISESGINTVEDIKRLKEANINGILVGESFMRCEDINKKAREFKNAYVS